jgi:mannose-6-phosphate isomerase-like protein (cupin superfamily)
MAKEQMVSSSPATISIEKSLGAIDKFFSPKTIARVNDTAIKITKLKGEFIWHFHEAEDELFFVVHGKLLMKLRTGDVWVNEGEFIVVPKGVEHCPVAPEEVHIMLVEPQSIKRTGNVTESSEAATNDEASRPVRTA